MKYYQIFTNHSKKTSLFMEVSDLSERGIMRYWSDTEIKILRESYPQGGCVATARLLHAAGFDDRDPVTVMKQASRLKVKRINVNRFTSDYSGRRRLNEARKKETR